MKRWWNVPFRSHRHSAAEFGVPLRHSRNQRDRRSPSVPLRPDVLQRRVAREQALDQWNRHGVGWDCHGATKRKNGSKVALFEVSKWKFGIRNLRESNTGRTQVKITFLGFSKWPRIRENDISQKIYSLMEYTLAASVSWEEPYKAQQLNCTHKILPSIIFDTVYLTHLSGSDRRRSCDGRDLDSWSRDLRSWGLRLQESSERDVGTAH